MEGETKKEELLNSVQKCSCGEPEGPRDRYVMSL